ncbi:MAG TPA: TetR/AcrR family transcriptional regulator [Myxococcota bacterium]|nr:TetR/AcrR family transcriptional regulator [Myxococcota bacterium]
MNEPIQPVKRPRGRPPLPRAGQRQRLVDAAIRAFDRTDGEKLTVSDIVAEAGMSSRTFYDHFESKDDLIAEIFLSQARRFVAALMSIAQRTRGPVERCDQALEAFFELFPAASAIDFERLGGDAGERVRTERRRCVNLITDGIVSELERMRQSGSLSHAPDRARIELILTGIEGLSMRYYSEGRHAEFDQLRPMIRELLLRATGF